MGEPLCTFKLYGHFQKLGETKNQQKFIEEARNLVCKLPPVNRDTFRSLLHFMKRITLYSADNKMTDNNLARVIAPNLFRQFEITQTDIIYAGIFVDVLTRMIRFAEEICQTDRDSVFQMHEEIKGEPMVEGAKEELLFAESA